MPDAMRYADDDGARYYAEVEQWRPLMEARELRRLTRMVYEGKPEKAKEEAVKLGLTGFDGPWNHHLLEVHRRLTYQYLSPKDREKRKQRGF